MDVLSLVVQELGRSCVAAIYSGLVKIYLKSGVNIFPKIHLVLGVLYLWLWEVKIIPCIEVQEQIMSLENIKFLFCSALICIVASAFLFPANVDSADPMLYRIGDWLGQVKGLRKVSDFPAALAMTHLVAVAFGYGLGLIASLSRELMRRAIKYVCSKGKFRCLWIGSALAFVSVYVIFFDNDWSHLSGRRATLLRQIPTSRFCLAYWCSGLFIISFCSLSFFIISVLGLFSSRGLSEQC